MNRLELDLLANRAENALALHRVPGRVLHVIEGPRLITFVIRLALTVKYSALRRRSDDLALALGVPSLRISRAADGARLAFPHPAPRPVHTRDLLRRVTNPGPARALLGLAGAGAPLLVNLASPDVAHVLLAGTTGSGKSVLLQTLLLSLLRWNPPAELQYLCIDPKRRAFTPFRAAAGLLRPPLAGAAIAPALAGAVALMEQRDRAGVSTPRLVLLIDELSDTLMADNLAEGYLIRLLQRGREAGINVIAATQRPSAALLSGLMRANFPLRLVGRVVSDYDAKVAAGVSGTGGELLLGRGDFLAVGIGPPRRFQAGYLEHSDIAALLPRRAPAELLTLPPAAVALPLRATPGALQRVRRDAAKLQQASEREQRRWESQTEAELWLCGYNGGAAHQRTRAAIALLAEFAAEPAATTLPSGLLRREPAQTG